MSKIAAIALAAGRSSRLPGSNKLFLDFGGRTLLEISLKNLSSLSLAQTVFVTGHDHESVEEFLSNNGRKFVRNGDYTKGMMTSIKAGFQALGDDIDYVLIYLCDLPLLTDEVLRELLKAHTSNPNRRLIVPTFNGERGNPALLSTQFKEEILNSLDSDRGCKFLFAKYPDDILEVPVQTESILRDVDSEADYRALIGSL